ncbi:hypothetical protein FB451DRAFT_1377212 [Mycena latifolia]|nr:hypothetical protein FB451DRAFT_1380842 [Mycena latifolia]KAJ7441757.1 hypothetical protein FB451DRAFT_1377212 [Mycena latifolia]
MSSPFTSKLGTNYCPQDEEILQIQTLLVEPTLRLKRLDDEIAVLQKALDKLAEERAGISAYVDTHKALISPARQLPLDVIQEIFTACIPTHRNCVMSAMEAPVLLGRICSSWRSISLSTPRLWSRLHIVEPHFTDPPDLFEKKLAQRLETTKMWLGRSGNCPLSISLQSNGLNYFAASQDRLIPALLPFASRWEHISFTALLSRLGIVSHLTEADVPMLKSVSINEPFGDFEDAIRWDSFGFLRAPKISSFSLKGGRSMDLPLRWDGLINLSITTTWDAQSSLTSETALQVLSRCPQLRTCDLVVDDPPDIVSNRLEEPVLELSFLHTLDLGCGTFQAVCRLFGCVSFPQLRNLKLRGISDNENMADVRFLATAPLIEKLEIINGEFSKLFLASFLRELPFTLRELNISVDFSVDFPGYDNPSFDDEVLESFSPSVDFPTPCCLGLQVLEIQYYCTISDKALVRFLKSRTLKRVVICFHRAMEHDIRPELQPLVQNGLHLALTYNPPGQYFSPWQGLPDAPNFFLAP